MGFVQYQKQYIKNYVRYLADISEISELFKNCILFIFVSANILSWFIVQYNERDKAEPDREVNTH